MSSDSSKVTVGHLRRDAYLYVFSELPRCW